MTSGGSLLGRMLASSWVTGSRVQREVARRWCKWLEASSAAHINTIPFLPPTPAAPGAQPKDGGQGHLLGCQGSGGHRRHHPGRGPDLECVRHREQVGTCFLWKEGIGSGQAGSHTRGSVEESGVSLHNQVGALCGVRCTSGVRNKECLARTRGPALMVRATISTPLNQAPSTAHLSALPLPPAFPAASWLPGRLSCCEPSVATRTEPTSSCTRWDIPVTMGALYRRRGREGGL